MTDEHKIKELIEILANDHKLTNANTVMAGCLRWFCEKEEYCLVCKQEQGLLHWGEEDWDFNNSVDCSGCTNKLPDFDVPALLKLYPLIQSMCANNRAITDED